MLCRDAAFVCPRHDMAMDLVASHISTLLACDKERKRIHSSYVAEPKLVMAAAELWNKTDFCFYLPQHSSSAICTYVRGPQP